MDALNGFDVALLVAAGILGVVGLVKGLVRILIGLGAIVAAFGLAAAFHRPLAERLDWFEIPDEVRLLLAYALVFIGVMLAGAIVAAWTRRLLRAAMLGWADRLGGALLGVATATLAAALVVVPLVAYSQSGRALVDGSVLAPYVTTVADLAAPLVPESLSRLYQDRMRALRQVWRKQRGRQRDLTSTPDLVRSSVAPGRPLLSRIEQPAHGWRTTRHRAIGCGRPAPPTRPSVTGDR